MTKNNYYTEIALKSGLLEEYHYNNSNSGSTDRHIFTINWQETNLYTRVVNYAINTIDISILEYMQSYNMYVNNCMLLENISPKCGDTNEENNFKLKLLRFMRHWNIIQYIKTHKFNMLYDEIENDMEKFNGIFDYIKCNPDIFDTIYMIDLGSQYSGENPKAHNECVTEYKMTTQNHNNSYNPNIYDIIQNIDIECANYYLNHNEIEGNYWINMSTSIKNIQSDIKYYTNLDKSEYSTDIFMDGLGIYYPVRDINFKDKTLLETLMDYDKLTNHSSEEARKMIDDLMIEMMELGELDKLSNDDVYSVENDNKS